MTRCFHIVVALTLACAMGCFATKSTPNRTETQPTATPATADEGQRAAAKDVPSATQPEARDSLTPEPAPQEASTCDGDYKKPSVVALVDTSELGEISGIVVSHYAPNIFWVHNDSGDKARLYAITDTGSFLGTLELPGVEADDFEDLTSGPCPGTSTPCLWVGDIGDNPHTRDNLTVHVFPEPEISPGAPFPSLQAENIQSFKFRVPNESLNSEAMMVDSATGKLYIFEKDDAEKIRLFVHPGDFSSDAVQLLTEVCSFAAPGLPVTYGKLITAADLHPSGKRVLVRVYSGSYEYRMADSQTLADLPSITPVLAAVGPPTEPQGEAACYSANGDGFWTISENQKGNDTIPLHYYGCKETPAAP